MATASVNLLIEQWRDQPNMLRIIQIWLDTYEDEIETPYRRLLILQKVDQATGVWLDYLGGRVGVARPSIEVRTIDGAFGFDDAGVGFNQRRFGAIRGLEARTPLGDALYRRLIKARGWYDYALGTLAWLRRAVFEIDAGATIVDAGDMTLTITTQSVALMELAVIHECLPIPAGVATTVTDGN